MAGRHGAGGGLSGSPVRVWVGSSRQSRTAAGSRRCRAPVRAARRYAAAGSLPVDGEQGEVGAQRGPGGGVEEAGSELFGGGVEGGERVGAEVVGGGGVQASW